MEFRVFYVRERCESVELDVSDGVCSEACSQNILVKLCVGETASAIESGRAGIMVTGSRGHKSPAKNKRTQSPKCGAGRLGKSVVVQ